METGTSKAPDKGNGNGKKTGRLHDVARWAELKQLGWKSEGKDGAWYASHPQYEERVGPAATIAALVTAVQLKIGNKIDLPQDEAQEVAKQGAESNVSEFPSSRLPGLEEPALEELDRLADIAIDAKDRMLKATSAYKDAADAMRLKMREHDRKRYSRRGYPLVIEDSEKLVIKKAEGKPAMNPSTKKAAGGKA